jgi:hypothetical protein
MRACAVAVSLLLLAVIALGALAWDRHGKLAAAEQATRVHVVALEQLAGQVREWRAAAEAQQVRADAAAARAVQVERAAERRAMAALQAEVPDDCAGAMAWGAAHDAEFARRWEAGR